MKTILPLDPCGYLHKVAAKFFKLSGRVLLLKACLLFIPSLSHAQTESLRANLFLLNTDGSTILADGVLTEFNNLYHDSVTLEDAVKFTNINENFGLLRYGSTLAVERRPIIGSHDTLFVKLWRTSQRDYQVQLTPDNFNRPDLDAFWVDSYLGSSTPLNLRQTNKIDFSVDANAASSAMTRFKIVFQPSVINPVPVTYSLFKASKLNQGIELNWKVENEVNLTHYDIERSPDGNTFSQVGTMNVNIIHGLVYSWIDISPVSGNNFYRIKSYDLNGNSKYSPVVNVLLEKNASSISVFPNPVKGNTINLLFVNRETGIYQVRLSNNSGQVVYNGKLPVSNGYSSQSVYANKKIASGIYQLEIKGPNNVSEFKKVIVQE